jgi:hypothetical protein
VRVLWLPDDIAASELPKSLRGLHFDYSEDDHHPVFHVQVDDRAITPEVLGHAYACDAERVETPRVPTAPMDLCATVYMILHDHFSWAVVQGWSEECLRAVEGMPRLPCVGWAERIDKQGPMDCSWWYPQHQRGYAGRGAEG